MKKAIVIYYSNKGSNRFLAKKIAEKLNCEIEEIKPRLNVHFLLLFGVSLGNRNLKNKIAEYDTTILCGPIWMGKFVAPLKAFVNKHKNDINKLVFVSCCGSSFEIKDKKFGHGLVFKEVKEILNDKCIHCEAFPITLIMPDDKKEDPQAVMDTRLTEESFKGEIRERFNAFIEDMSAKLNKS